MKKLVLLVICLFMCACTKNIEPLPVDNKEERESPVISLLGDEEISLTLGDVYEEPGYTATDKIDGDITDKVEVEGEVLKSVGEYTLTYKVLNSEGLSSSKTRKINVTERIINENASFVPVLMYHYFYDDEAGETGKDGNYLAKSLFVEQLEYLKKNDYYFPTMKELREYIDGKRKLPPKSIILTMDDGAESNYRIAYPLALQYKIPIVWFVVTSWTDPSLPFQQEILNSGYVTMESHTHDLHKAGCSGMGHGGAFMCVDYNTGLNDLKTSFNILKTATSVAYPFGDYNDEAKKIVHDAGFDLAFTTEWGTVKPGMDPYSLPRVRISDGNPLSTFISSIS